MVVNKSCVAACQKSVRMTVESVSGCSWNECPDQRGITVRMRVEWVSESAWNPHSGSEILPLVLNYIGLPSQSTKPGDYSKAAEKLGEVRQHIRSFNGSNYITDLANGNICVAVGYSGDILQAAAAAKEAKKPYTIAYSIPKEGSTLWFDMMAIPADAKNRENAYLFINYILQPEVIAPISNYVSYANPNRDATPLVDKAITSNTGIYPPQETIDRLWVSDILPAKIQRTITRTWTKIKTGK